MPADSIVRSRIDTATKQRAAAALEAMGLTISDAIRLLLLRVADEKRLPFDVKVPNAKSRQAMQELAEGKGKLSASAAALFKDLVIRRAHAGLVRPVQTRCAARPEAWQGDGQAEGRPLAAGGGKAAPGHLPRSPSQG
ncbi:MAG TPA: type II toxin-antitoxin system RelB/DinJ family antitoxin [Acetobacteraceae bacterium]|jgi:DNA-damage-inducible protein J